MFIQSLACAVCDDLVGFLIDGDDSQEKLNAINRVIHRPQYGVVDDAEKAIAHCVGLISLSSSSSPGLVKVPQNCTEPFDFLEVKEKIEMEIFTINDPPLVQLHKAKTLANL